MFCALWVFIVDTVHVGSLNRLYIIQLFLNQVLKKCNNFLEVWWFLCHLLGAGAAKRIEKSYFGPSPPNSSACFASCWIQGYCPKPKLFFLNMWMLVCYIQHPMLVSSKKSSEETYSPLSSIADGMHPPCPT